MESYSIVIILLAIAIGLFPIANKLKIPYPILLLIIGIAIGFIPNFTNIMINPEVVFFLFLPPMLYDAAYNIHFKDFKQNISTISLMAVLLVFITTAGIAVIVHYCIPNMSWSLSFVLGAILSPPDAIAATGVTKGLGLPQRTNTILEGESLINDASTLVAFRFAVAAVAGSTFILREAGLIFLISLIGGLLVGILLSLIFLFITRKRFDTNIVVSLNLMLPFVAYLIAEEFHVSGVISSVIVGLQLANHKNIIPEKIVTTSKSVLDIIIFLLGGLVFILIGLQFPKLLKHIPSENILSLIGCAFLIFFVALIIRMLVIFWHKQKTKKRYENLFTHINSGEIHKRELLKIRLSHQLKNRTLDEFLEERRQLLLTNKEAIIIGWSGMRGIVSLAAALSLPLLMEDGTDFPQRDTIIFLTVAVVIIMLLIQGLGLPLLMKLLKI
ncbi:MAG: cation:proton antiporter [Bacteroidales bacterium]|jgi:CPA1 family monovalent cation:H+ antiporter|nr:cation:proton antiporter [Bacteroidales bacterium]